MNLIINGEELQVTDVRSVSELLDHLKLDGKRVAVEVNLEIVRRDARSVIASSVHVSLWEQANMQA